MQQWLIATDQTGNTPLHLAAKRGHVDMVKYLITDGASVGNQNSEKDIPLHLAALHDHLAVVKCLVAKNPAQLRVQRAWCLPTLGRIRLARYL